MIDSFVPFVTGLCVGTVAGVLIMCLFVGSKPPTGPTGRA